MFSYIFIAMNSVISPENCCFEMLFTLFKTDLSPMLHGVVQARSVTYLFVQLRCGSKLLILTKPFVSVPPFQFFLGKVYIRSGMSYCQNFNSYQCGLEDHKTCELSHQVTANKSLDKRNRQEVINKLLEEWKIRTIEKNHSP